MIVSIDKNTSVVKTRQPISGGGLGRSTITSIGIYIKELTSILGRMAQNGITAHSTYESSLRDVNAGGMIHTAV